MIHLANVNFIRNDIPILHNINLNIPPKSHWVLLGKNGSGKSTLVDLIYGMQWPTSGEITVLNQKYGTIPLSQIQKKIGILQPNLQETNVQKNLTAEEIVTTGLLGTIGFYNEPDLGTSQKVREIFSKNNLSHLKNRNYTTLSAGEKRKILLLRSVINQPELLLLDEPCSSFDIAAREDFFDILSNLIKQNAFGSLLITHRLDEIPNYYTDCILLKKGEILAQGNIQSTLTSEAVSEMYDIKVKVFFNNGRFNAIVEN